MTESCCAPSSDEAGRAISTARQSTLPRTVVPRRPPKDMAYIPGGPFLMGTDDLHRLSLPTARVPAREVEVSPFYIDETSVTNAQFARFARATKYRTEAERYGWSFVFHLFVHPRLARKVTQAVANAQWWWRIDGASWRRPEGPGSGISRRMDHPVTHISWNDAQAYCRNGRASVCRPRPNGRWPRAEVSTPGATPGATTSPPVAGICATSGRATSPTANTEDDGYCRRCAQPSPSTPTASASTT